MGRLASDVVALACIAGGAVVGAGVTAGLVASTDPAERDVHVVCADAVDAPTVVVRLGSGSAYVAARSVQVGSAHDGCDASARIRIVETAEWTDQARARAEAALARTRAQEIRLRAEDLREVRLRTDDLRIESDRIRMTADALRLQLDRAAAEATAAAEVEALEGAEATARAALEAVERQLTEAERQWAESGLEGRALTEALENLRRSLRESVESGGND